MPASSLLSSSTQVLSHLASSTSGSKDQDHLHSISFSDRGGSVPSAQVTGRPVRPAAPVTLSRLKPSISSRILASELEVSVRTDSSQQGDPGQALSLGLQTLPAKQS